MQVQVKLFASLREQLGFGEREVELAEGQTVDDLWAVISGRPEVPPDVLRAVNMDYVKGDRILSEGDEVAFFPPVTGG